MLCLVLTAIQTLSSAHAFLAWADDKVWIAVKTKHSAYKKELNDCIKNLDFNTII